MNQIKIFHLSSVHSRTSSRIFHKMCKSLSNTFSVSFLISDTLKSEKINNVEIIGFTKSSNSYLRPFFSSFLFLKYILKNRPEIIHLHDPELIPLGLILKFFKIKIVFDSHEDIPLQILNKNYLSKPSAKLISLLSYIFQWLTLPFYSALITPTETIKGKLLLLNKKTISIKNYPSLKDFNNKKLEHSYDVHPIYVGALSTNRGIDNLCKASLLMKKPLNINFYGKFDTVQYENSILNKYRDYPVSFKGFLPLEKLINKIKDSSVGLVTLKPIPNYIEALPIKMFEYMACSIPIIISDFPLWRKIVETYKCGLIDEAKEMGRNGRKAIEEFYNWENEYSKLENLYKSLIYLK